MNTHDELLRVIETGLYLLPQRGGLPLPADVLRWVERIPFQRLHEADEMCRKFAATLEWPPMDEEAQTQIGLRMMMAKSMCEMKAEMSFDETVSRADRIEFLLVYQWHRTALTWAEVVFRAQREKPSH